MRPFNDLIISAIIATLSWLAYERFGILWAAAVIVVGAGAFIWWNIRTRSNQE